MKTVLYRFSRRVRGSNGKEANLDTKLYSEVRLLHLWYLIRFLNRARREESNLTKQNLYRMSAIPEIGYESDIDKKKYKRKNSPSTTQLRKKTKQNPTTLPLKLNKKRLKQK